MTLKEKFDETLTYLESKRKVSECEKVAEEFAIGFAEWFTNEQSPYSIMFANQEIRFSDFRKDYTIKELLEIYKEEKKL
jgi:hypothetical protein